MLNGVWNREGEIPPIEWNMTFMPPTIERSKWGGKTPPHRGWGVENPWLKNGQDENIPQKRGPERGKRGTRH
jgi:hypothetical protein